MNYTEHLEHQLRSWTPRQPSEKLETKLFGALTRPSIRPAMSRECLRWLSPALGCLLLTVAILRRENPQLLMNREPASLLTGLSANNPSTPHDFAGNSTHNLWKMVTFEWTTDTQSTSTVSPLTQSGTNRLMR